MTYQQSVSTSISDSSSMVSLWLCLLPPSIPFSFPCLPKFCPINKSLQFLYSLLVITAHRGDSHISSYFQTLQYLVIMCVPCEKKHVRRLLHKQVNLLNITLEDSKWLKDMQHFEHDWETKHRVLIHICDPQKKGRGISSLIPCTGLAACRIF